MTPEEKSHAFPQAFFLCVLLFGGAFYGLKTYPIPQAYLSQAFAVSIFFSIALISVLIYQSKKIYESAHSLAQVMTVDLLEFSREMFSELYRSSPVPYFVITEDGFIESANASAARFFNVDIPLLSKLNVFSHIVEARGHAFELIPTYFRNAQPLTAIEVRIKRPDGVEKWAMLSLFTFKGRRNVRKGLLTLVDITKLKQIDIAKTEFVSLASHQLRTPISGMKWNMELVTAESTGTLNEAQRAYIDKISRSLHQMSALVDDFLSASKFELGTLTPVFAPCDTMTFFTDIYNEHREMAEKKGITIDLHIDEGSITTDEHLFHMVASNLLSNAVKYTPEGGTIKYHAVLDTARLTLTVADSGMGIPLADQESIFTKMYRASNARNHTAGGTGLGLYIAKEAVTILKGTIQFESVESEGTTFTVIVPR
jgi:PAS domain S-box-containing protein